MFSISFRKRHDQKMENNLLTLIIAAERAWRASSDILAYSSCARSMTWLSYQNDTTIALFFKANKTEGKLWPLIIINLRIPGLI